MITKRLAYLLITISLTAILILTGCNSTSTNETTTPVSSNTSQTTTTTAARSGGQLTIIDIEFIAGPFGYIPDITPGSYSFLQPALEAFFNYDIKGNPVPMLATDWEFSNDNKSVTFNLRKGVKFHDGSDFNAKVAKWNLDLRQATKGTGTGNWDSVEIVNDYAVKVNLKQYTATALIDLASLTRMMSKEAVEKNGVDWARFHLVSTGPFMLKEYKENESIEWTRFDGYWGQKPYLDSVKYIYIPNSVTASLALQSGQANVLHIMGGANLVGSELASKGYNIVLPASYWASLVPDSNKSDSPFANLKVRQAVEYAIDKKTITEKVGLGYWTADYEPAYSWQTGYVKNYPQRTYDPVKAKALLTEAGYPNGFKTSIVLPSNLNGDSLTSIKSYLGAVGIEVDLQAVTFGKHTEYTMSGWPGLLFSPLGGSTVDYTSFLANTYSPTRTQNVSLAIPDGLEAIRLQAISEPDSAKRVILCENAIKLLVDQCAIIPLWECPAVYAMDKSVQDNGIMNWQLPFIFDWTKVWLSK